MVGSEQYSPISHVFLDLFLDCVPVTLAIVLRPAGDDQPVIVALGQKSVEMQSIRYSSPLYGVILPKNKIVFLVILDAESLLRVVLRERRLRNSIIDPERDDVTRARCTSKLLAEFKLHLLV